MGKSPFPIILTPEEEQTLKKNVANSKTEQRIVFRSRIILLCADDLTNKRIARKLKTPSKTISKWRERFYFKRLKGLKDEQRTGRPKKFQYQLKYELVHLSCSNPDSVFKGLTKWSYRKLALALIMKKLVEYISFTRVMTWLKGMDLKPQKVKYWLNPTDPNFHEKMYAIVDLYHNPPQGEPILCLDEKTGIQVLTPLYPDKESSKGDTIYREYDYVRKGTLCLLGGYNITSGKCHGIVRETHKTKDFIDLLKFLIAEYPDAKRIHLVLDNFTTHKSKELKKWLSENENPFIFHFLPFHGSWLNQIEIWFGIFSRECLKRANCESKEEKKFMILDYIETYNKCFAHAFKWQYGKELLKVK